MPKPSFPRDETRRVEYGEIVKNIKVSVVNGLEVPRKLRLTLLLKTASRKVQERILKKFVAGETMVVDRKSECTMFGPYSVSFKKGKFATGTYALEAEIVLLDGNIFDEEFPKGWTIQERELIYLNVDPPAGRGLFEYIEPVKFKREKDLQFRVIHKDEKMRIQINMLHPAYKYNEDLDDLLAKKKLYAQHRVERPLIHYELGIGAEAITQFDISKDVRLLQKGREQFIAKRDEDKRAFFEEAINTASRIAQKIRYEIL